MSAKRFTVRVWLVLFLVACTPAISPTLDTSRETVTSTAIPERTSTPSSTRTPQATATEFSLLLQKIETLPNGCSEMEVNLPAEGLRPVSYLPSGYCFHGELDIFEMGGRVYVAQVILSNFPTSAEAFRIIDVTDAEQPVQVGAWKWNIPSYSSDVKAFRQGDRWFLALSRDPNLTPNVLQPLCAKVGGIAIIEVTDPTNPKVINLLTGETTGSKAKWCKSHTTQVSLDADGNGVFLYVSAIDIADLRVLDIRDLENVTEAGHYTHPDAGFYNERNNFFVHDTTIVDDRVYVAHWSAGLIILDRQALEEGKRVTPLNPLDSIDPWGMQVHHAFPTIDGNFVFVEDEFPSEQPPSLLRLYDIRDLQAPKEVAAITLSDSWGAPHNLLVSGDLLFVGWYQDGVRVYRYDTSNPEHPAIEPYAYQAVRAQFTTNRYTGVVDGIWGVRLHTCVVADQPRTCVYASDMTWGLLILTLEP